MKLKQYIEKHEMSDKNGIRCIVIIGQQTGEVIGTGKDYKDASVIAYEYWASGNDNNTTFLLSYFDGIHPIGRKYFHAEDMKLI